MLTLSIHTHTHTHYTPCSKKDATKLMAVTSSNLNWFSKFLHHWKETEISNKYMYYFPPHLKYVAALPLGIQKFKFAIKLPNKIKTHITFVKKLKFHSYGWMDIVIITTAAQIVQRLLAHMREETPTPRHSSIALSMTLWSIPCQRCSKRCYYYMYYFLWF